MTKAIPKGAPTTPPIPRPPSSRSHLHRRVAAAPQPGRQTEQRNPPKAAAEESSQSRNGVDDVAGKTQTSDAATGTFPPLAKIADELTDIIQKHQLEDVVKQRIEKVIGLAREEEEAEAKWAAEPKVQAKVRTICAVIQQNLETVYNNLSEQINNVERSTKEALHSTSEVLKEVSETKAATQDIAGKVSKVTEVTDKIVSETVTYRDALLAGQKQASKANVDPRVLSDMDRRAKQILVEIFDIEGNNTLAKSLTELVNKANEVIAAIVDAEKPKDTRVLTALKTRREAVLFTLTSKDAVDWINQPQNEMAFTKAFSEGSHIRGRAYNLVVPRVPVTFNPKEDKHLREIEEVNGLGKDALSSVKWIKPIGRRRPDQTHAYAIFSFATANSANSIIRDGLNICGTKVRPKKQKQEAIQCMKCRRWGHFATECQSEEDTCGSCGESHRTSSCKNKGKVHCVSCNVSAHPSWDRNCPEFIKRCAIIDERNPENGMPYFPTEHDWTHTARPDRIPLEERFPKKFAVNGLPFAANKHPGLPPRNSWKKRGKNGKKGMQDREDADGNEQANPNLIPINRRREEGDLPTDAETGPANPEGEGADKENTDETSHIDHHNV